MPNDQFIKHHGQQVVAQMNLGKTLEQAYSNVVGQALAETLVDSLIKTLKSKPAAWFLAEFKVQCWEWLKIQN